MKIAFIASPKQAAQEASRQLALRYSQCDMSDAEYVVAIGGDGTALKALYAVMAGGHQPVYAMRLAGSLGFLANAFALENLPERLQTARRLTLSPLKAEVEHAAGNETVFAVNEIVLMRQRLQAAKLLAKAGSDRSTPLIGDGLLMATPIGSSGYNRSAGGSRLPPDSSLLALTALARHHRSDWCNRVHGAETVIEIEVVDPDHRPVALQTSMQELSDVRRARISSCLDLSLVLLLDGRGNRSNLTEPLEEA
jgi:NAD+ kinase